MNTVNAVPVIGQPIAYGIGFAVLILVTFTGSWASALVTVAHEGGHMFTSVLTGRGFTHFYLEEDTGFAGTWVRNGDSRIIDIIIGMSGYPMPPLLGLAGAALISQGQAWSVLWAALFLLFIAFLRSAPWNAEGPFTSVVTGLAVLGVGWVAINGTSYLRAAVAVALVWLLLIGGAYQSASLFQGKVTGDATKLAQWTWIPAPLWDLAFAVVGITTLVAGVKYLL